MVGMSEKYFLRYKFQMIFQEYQGRKIYRKKYLVIFIELNSFFLRTASPNWADINQTISKFYECAPTKGKLANLGHRNEKTCFESNFCPKYLKTCRVYNVQLRLKLVIPMYATFGVQKRREGGARGGAVAPPQCSPGPLF